MPTVIDNISFESVESYLLQDVVDDYVIVKAEDVSPSGEVPSASNVECSEESLFSCFQLSSATECSLTNIRYSSS